MRNGFREVDSSWGCGLAVPAGVGSPFTLFDVSAASVEVGASIVGSIPELRRIANAPLE